MRLVQNSNIKIHTEMVSTVPAPLKLKGTSQYWETSLYTIRSFPHVWKAVCWGKFQRFLHVQNKLAIFLPPILRIQLSTAQPFTLFKYFLINIKLFHSCLLQCNKVPYLKYFPTSIVEIKRISVQEICKECIIISSIWPQKIEEKERCIEILNRYNIFL